MGGGVSKQTRAANYQDQRCWRSCVQVGENLSYWKGSDTSGKWMRCTVTGFDAQKTLFNITVSEGDNNNPISVPVNSSDILPRMAYRGMSLQHFRAFVALCKAEVREKDIRDPREHLDLEKTIINPNYLKPLVFDEAPTWLVVKLFLMPRVVSRRVPFVDLLGSLFPGLGGPRKATHFASHSWGSRFLDLLKGMEEAGASGDCYFWVCCFAMTQDAVRIELVDSNEVFAEALRDSSTQHVLICDSSMQALTRSWVLFELLRSYQFNKKVILSPLQALTDSAEMKCYIHISKAGCDREHDRQYIIGEIDKIGGVDELNKQVSSGVANGFRKKIEEFQLTKSYRAMLGSREVEVQRLRAQLGYVLIQQGDFASAVKELRACSKFFLDCQQRSSKSNVTAAEYSAVLFNLGRALSFQGQHDEGAQCIRGAIAVDGHHAAPLPAIAQKRLELVTVYRRMARFAAAEEELRAAMKEGEDVDSPMSRAGYHLQLGQLLSHFMWKHAAAETEFQLAITIYDSQKVAVEDKDYSLLRYNLAHALRRQGRLVQAEMLYRDVLKKQLHILSPNHLECLNTQMNLAITLTCQCSYQEAQAMLEAVLVKRKRGESKEALTRACLANVLRLSGRPEEAIEHYNEALASYSKLNFGEHNEIAWCKFNLGIALCDVKEKSKALAEFEEAIVMNERIFGPDHPSNAEVKAVMLTLKN